MGKFDQNFHICLRSGPRGLKSPPPLTVSLTVKIPGFFYDLPYNWNEFLFLTDMLCL